MARPAKQGLTYFPLDTALMTDDVVYLLEEEMGIEGFGILIKLLSRIYSDKGYYAEWNDRHARIFARKSGTEISNVQSAIKICLESGFFDQSVFEKHQVLTSKGIQKRYLEATKKRTKVKMQKKLILVSLEVLAEKTKQIEVVSEEKTPEKEEFTETKVTKSTQSKVKESKEKEIKVKSSLELAFDDFRKMRKKIRHPMTERAEELIWKDLEKLANTDEEKIEILNQSIKRGWRGVFEVKSKSNDRASPTETKSPLRLKLEEWLKNFDWVNDRSTYAASIMKMAAPEIIKRAFADQNCVNPNILKKNITYLMNK